MPKQKPNHPWKIRMAEAYEVAAAKKSRLSAKPPERVAYYGGRVETVPLGRSSFYIDSLMKGVK